jgi:hypothetical protein
MAKGCAAQGTLPPQLAPLLMDKDAGWENEDDAGSIALWFTPLRT